MYLFHSISILPPPPTHTQRLRKFAGGLSQVQLHESLLVNHEPGNFLLKLWFVPTSHLDYFQPLINAT